MNSPSKKRNPVEGMKGKSIDLDRISAYASQYAQKTQSWVFSRLHKFFPAGDRLAYIFKPGCADLVSLGLLLLLTWTWAASWTLSSVAVMLGLAAHIITTWVGHQQNITKLRLNEELISSVQAQKALLLIKAQKLQDAVGEVAQLKSEISLKEQQVKQVDQLQTQHEQLVRRLSAMAAFEQQLAAAQAKLAHLPKLRLRAQHLQQQRKLMGRLQWACSVLKAETASAPSVKAEYARLKALRAEIHELRPKLESEAQEVGALERRHSELKARATRARVLREEVSSLEREAAEVAALEVAAREARDRAGTTRHALKENTNAFKVYGGVEGVAADKMAQPANNGTRSAGSHPPIPRPTKAASAGTAAAPQPPRATDSSLSSAATGSAQADSSPPQLPPHVVMLGTPHGGARVYGMVVDNEAFYTPAHTSFPAASPSPAPFLGTFTPGPEAAALAAALAAGMAVPSKSGQASGACAADAQGAGVEEVQFPGVAKGGDHRGQAHSADARPWPAASNSGSVPISVSLGGGMQHEAAYTSTPTFVGGGGAANKHAYHSKPVPPSNLPRPFAL